LVELDARVVLVGVGLERCSILHHAERLVLDPDEPAYATVIEVDGERRWVDVYGGAGCSEGFGVLEPDLRAEGALDELAVGDAPTRMVAARAVVAAATRRLREDPAALRCAPRVRARCPVCQVEPAGAAPGQEADSAGR
jgi:aminoglycoside 3-N-acetyltransferase